MPSLLLHGRIVYIGMPVSASAYYMYEFFGCYLLELSIKKMFLGACSTEVMIPSFSSFGTTIYLKTIAHGLISLHHSTIDSF